MTRACCEGLLGSFPVAPRSTPLPIPPVDAHLFAHRRRKLWELAETFHCSVIGTCLTAGELRKILGKLNLLRAGQSDHALHGIGVGLAGRPAPGAKLLHKALDKCHAAALKRFAAAEDEAALRALWRHSIAAGEIPGPYWAVMTHPAAGLELIGEAFGHVHMLSHLVGAANRADIRRLSALEAECEALRERLDRQERQQQETLRDRDAALEGLQRRLAAQVTPPAPAAAPDDTARERLEQRLALEGERRAAAEARIPALQAALEEAVRERAAAEHQAAELQRDLDALERQWAAPEEARPDPALAGLSLLYVGGRQGQARQLRQLSEGRGAIFLHHDGGIEDGGAQLASLASRSDVVLFPVDCVSHDAALTVKRLCKQSGKPFLPLRSAGQASFLAALARLAVAEAPRA